MTYMQEYQALILEFAHQHNVDLEVDYEWPTEVEAEWRALVSALQAKHGRTPL